VLAGLAIGNGWIDPKQQYPGYVDFAYEKKLLTKGTPVRLLPYWEGSLISRRRNIWTVFSQSACKRSLNSREMITRLSTLAEGVTG